MDDVFSSWSPAMTGLALFVAGAFAILALKLIWGMAQWGRKSPHRLGDQMANARAEVTDWAGREGEVRVGGELWRAQSFDELSTGDEVVVTRVDGLRLNVKKK